MGRPTARDAAQERCERELDQEIRHHLALETDKNLRSGMGTDEACRRALVDFGGVEIAKEAHRDGRGARWAEELAQLNSCHSTP